MPEHISAADESLLPLPRWIAIYDARAASSILTSRLGDGRQYTKIRFFIKVLTSPHLAIPGVAVIGVQSRINWQRFAGSALWLFRSILVPHGTPWNASRRPFVLNWTHDWEVVNLAALLVGRRPGAAIYLGKHLIRLADEHQLTLWADARGEDRLVDAYAAHGFVPCESEYSSKLTLLMRRQPPTIS
ncbi:hypothetical protein [Mycobacterium ahvazicum]|uniref:hypothetical protein n=1 Tax=Mycobacterium ahvazicum TaxID=1964395 RepID=UPI0010575DB2|nr:hypothetical protein [Mycobacterium ahvazicum]